MGFDGRRASPHLTLRRLTSPQPYTCFRDCVEPPHSLKALGVKAKKGWYVIFGYGMVLV